MNKYLFTGLCFSVIFLIGQLSLAQSLTDSLKAHYTFDKTTLDSSPTNSDLNSNSTIAWTSFHGADSAIYFDGNSRISTIGSFDNSYFKQASVSLWVNTGLVNSKKRVIFQGAYMAFGIYINPNNKICSFFRTPSISAVCHDTTIVDSTWHHIVAQNDGDTTFLYIDGNFSGKKYQRLLVGNGSSNNKIYLGNKHDFSFPFKGSVNDFRIYNRMLTQKEIDSLSTYPTLPVGMNEVKKQNLKTIIYPNPTTSIVNIVFDSNFHGGQLNVRNITGQLLSSSKIKNQNKVEIELTGEKGLYFIELIDQKGNITISKLVKN